MVKVVKPFYAIKCTCIVGWLAGTVYAMLGWGVRV